MCKYLLNNKRRITEKKRKTNNNIASTISNYIIILLSTKKILLKMYVIYNTIINLNILNTYILPLYYMCIFKNKGSNNGLTITSLFFNITLISFVSLFLSLFLFSLSPSLFLSWLPNGSLFIDQQVTPQITLQMHITARP